MKVINVGDIFPTREGGNVRVIAMEGYRKISVQFMDENKAIRTIQAGQLRRGGVVNPYVKTAFGVGYIGEGPYNVFNNGCARAYYSWQNMMERCYSKQRANLEHYNGCLVDPRWHNFQEFAAWYYADKTPPGYQIDKDILMKGNRVYSSENCCLVPLTINSLITNNRKRRGTLPVGVTLEGGRYRVRVRVDSKKLHLGSYDTPEEAFAVYRKAKEANIKRMAHKYRKYIKPEVYEALMRYEVEIDD